MERGERGRGRKKAKRQRQGEEGGRGEWGKGGRRRKRGRGEKEEEIVTKWGYKIKIKTFFCFFTMFSLWEWAVLTIQWGGCARNARTAQTCSSAASRRLKLLTIKIN